MDNKSNRIQITPEQIKEGLDRFYAEYDRRLKQKGYGTLSSVHEILGVVTEEYRKYPTDKSVGF